MRIYDITLPIESTLAAWPGDTPYTFTSNLKICNGESVNLGSVSLSVHTGSHADAPYHYDDSGETIEQLSLSVYLGPAMVVDVSGKSVLLIDDITTSGATLAECARQLRRAGAVNVFAWALGRTSD